VRVPPGALHVCYCHTPMRYAWGFEDLYFSRFPAWLMPLVRLATGALRSWDARTADNVHHFVSNSENVRGRIREFYGREAQVVHGFFKTSAPKKEDYYLAVSAFVPYKRLDLVIEAFNGFEDRERTLLIAGSGPLDREYRSRAHKPSTRFLGAVTDEELRGLYAGARALIFPTDEDFGIVPLEAQAAGVPVIALARGGALESVKSGVFFDEQSAAAIRKAVLEFEEKSFDPRLTATRVQAFDRTEFKRKMRELITAFRGTCAANAAAQGAAP
jgi:glycosyltransferase involved in cell wall biosynthesis